MSLRNGIWHGLRNDIIMRNVKYGNGAKNKLNRKAYARLCRAFLGSRWHKFEGTTALPVRLLLMAQTNRAEQHIEVHEDRPFHGL